MIYAERSIKVRVKREMVKAGLLLGIAHFVFGQAVSFHSPVPWITLRENIIIAKTLIDTAEVKKNTVKLTLSKVINGKKKQIDAKKFKSEDYSQEYELATVDDKILGGKDFLRIDWQVVGTDKKGMILPFGIAEVGEVTENDAVKCKKISGKLGADALSSQLQDKDFLAAGNLMFCPVWNDNVLGLVCKNVEDMENVVFAVDGKNGKNAFLAFSDRIVTYYPKNDSLHALYYKRGIVDEAITYDEKKWVQEIKKDKKDGLVVITVPWHDLGMLAADGRIFGFSVFAAVSEKESAAFPKTAQKEIPGTWGNVVLKK